MIALVYRGMALGAIPNDLSDMSGEDEGLRAVILNSRGVWLTNNGAGWRRCAAERCIGHEDIRMVETLCMGDQGPRASVWLGSGDNGVAWTTNR